MINRLTDWLGELDAREHSIESMRPFRQYGRLTRATGLVMEAVGLKLPIGTLCIVERKQGAHIHKVESEVVGFNGQIVYLMPLENVDGVLPVGACLRPESEGGKQLPLGPELLGRVLDASARPLDGLPPQGVIFITPCLPNPIILFYVIPLKMCWMSA